MHTLEWDDGLAMAARDHCLDQGPASLVGNFGTDGSQFQDRIRRYGTVGDFKGESLSYGRSDLTEIMVSLMVEGSISLYSTRENVLN